MIHSFSKAGSYHQSAGTKNQDFVFSGSLGNFSVIALADGVSSCRMARNGAEIACMSFTELMLKLGSKFFGNTDRFSAAKMILAHIRGCLGRESGSPEISEYSSTIAGVLYDSEHSRILCFNLGDGMIAALSETGCRVLMRPYEYPEGCCSTTTLNAHKAAGLEIFSTGSENAVIIFSDGAWRQIYRDKRISLLNGGLKFSELDEYFAGSSCYDDCSYIALTLKGGV